MWPEPYVPVPLWQPRYLRCGDLRWIALPHAPHETVPCPDCQPGVATIALKRGHRR